MVIRSHHPALCRKVVTTAIKNMAIVQGLVPDWTGAGCPGGAAKYCKRGKSDAGDSVIFFYYT